MTQAWSILSTFDIKFLKNARRFHRGVTKINEQNWEILYTIHKVNVKKLYQTHSEPADRPTFGPCLSPCFESLVTSLIAWLCLMANCACACYPCLNLSTDVICKNICLPKYLLHCSFVAFAYLSSVKVVLLGNNIRGRLILTVVKSISWILRVSEKPLSDV